MEIVLTFENTNHSVKAEQALLAGGIAVAVMPLPAAIRAGCGLCLRVALPALEQAEALLAGDAIPIQGRYSRSDGGYQPYPAADGNE